MEEIYAACITYEPGIIDYVDLKKLTEPVWLLGKQYRVHEGDEFEKLNEDIVSKPWFTYRKQFSAIGDSGLTSDSGWGCMHRCGQMLMAQALIVRHLGREFTWCSDDPDQTYLSLMEQFDDRPECRYSIHSIAIEGSLLEKQIGQWYGPNTVVQILKRLAEEDEKNDLVLHVAMDNMVIKKEIRKLLRRKRKNEEDNRRSPILLTVPLRLGLSEIIPTYFEKLKAAFRMKQSLGIIGGRTNHASYFIGYVGKELIYLDPHTTQIYKSPREDSTFHCSRPSRMDFTQLDPSVALSFYIESESDFEQWCTDARQVLLEPEKDALFEILEEKPPMMPYVDIELDDDFDASLNERDRIYTSDEEFELLM
ncbi:cysteine protease ATG4B-like [Uloborus diversus]|uniref:cysteine protease ATG4B-like n=1 Tax=Uloborus diversus TaxID=327109 RepID=UPI002409477B|nr:cysteine protease ATG4B-like [Uloborus diversus]